ncbi:MAG: glycosyltransferase, partial [Bacteroidota bacterium]
ASEAATRAPELRRERFVVLSIGRFVALKGFDMTILSFATFYHSLPANEQANAKLVLVGKGPELTKLQQLIEQHNVSESVEIIHWVERSELSKIYQSASVFFFPSHEGAGMVVPEAMSYGVPVLCYDNFGPGEMVDVNCGRTILYSNYEHSRLLFAQQLRALYDEPELLEALSEGAFQKHRTQFQWACKAKIFQEAYRGL